MEFKAPNTVSDGVYDAKLKIIEKRDPGEMSLTQNPYFRWIFEVYTKDEPGGIELVKNTSMNFGPKSHARKYVQSLLGKPIQPGETVRMSDYLPMACQVVVKIDPESAYSRIVDIMGAKKRENGKEGEGEAL